MMTKDQVIRVLTTIAEEFEAAAGDDRDELRELARAYRRAAELVQEVEERRRPGRPRGSGRTLAAPRTRALTQRGGAGSGVRA
jgi:pyridoxal biosynthesis lyase PdxS